MRKHIFFLRSSSIVIKVAAWIILFLGILGAVTLFTGATQCSPRWMGFVILAFYIFSFLVLFLIAKMSDILIQLINQVQKD